MLELLPRWPIALLDPVLCTLLVVSPHILDTCIYVLGSADLETPSLMQGFIIVADVCICVPYFSLIDGHSQQGYQAVQSHYEELWISKSRTIALYSTCNYHLGMDPISVMSLAGAVFGVIDVITRSVNYLLNLQTRYKKTDLKVSLLIGQLSTLRAALNQISALINTSLVGRPQHQQLVDDLKISIEGCKVLISVLDDQFQCFEEKETVTLGTIKKIHFLWEEEGINDYLNHLDNQINALNLLLTALQWSALAKIKCCWGCLANVILVDHFSSREICYKVMRVVLLSSRLKTTCLHYYGYETRIHAIPEGA